MFNKILIANRGEIALRVIRTCKELGIRSVAIYSESDRYALHVKRADEAYCLSEDPLKAYLDGEKILQVAQACQCDALHPGYGFLSENGEFARLCEEKGIRFIGPKADVILQMGSKVEARRLMSIAGVPVIPGSDGNLKDCEQAKVLAKSMGYPVMLKATHGGGGRGIRLCQDEESLENAYERVVSEASKAFGKSELFLEKYIARPKHIEVQILADNEGKVLHLFERDCSIQRRHQKLVEIAPSPQISESLRQKICGYAVKAAQAVGYTNAGTVEFMVTEEEAVYFLEMNTRLQVEHPITEQITGIDIVEQQIAIAAGRTLSLEQGDIQRRGYAIEFRINAEDPKNDFLPSFGKISKYYAPGGPGVRTDSAIYTGYHIPNDYDSLCAKLTVWGLDWSAVLRRAKRALCEMRLWGVKTTIPYYLEILATRDFQAACFDTSFVENHSQLSQYSERVLPQHRAAVIAAAIHAYASS